MVFISFKFRSSEEKLNLKGQRKTKLPILEPIQVYPYDALAAIDQEGDAAYKAALLERMQDTFQKLTTEEKDQIEVRIELNPEFAEKVTNIDPKEREFKKPFGKFPINKQLRTGAAKYNIVLYLKNKPFAIVSSPYSTTLLDTDLKTEINPLTITKKQAGELFLGLESSKDGYKQIRINYAAALEIEKIISKLISRSDANEVIKTIGDLKKLKIDLTSIITRHLY